MNKPKIMIAMSGGVDSSVAAHLLKSQGFECLGATMKLFESQDAPERAKTCCALRDVEDARSVANRLDIHYYVLNFKADFQADVIERFVSAWENGLTPNPCIDCNSYLKFSKLFTRAQQVEAAYLATGHYARIAKDEKTGRYLLKKAVDKAKDQSYFLYTMTQAQLQRTLFPLGNLSKSEIRKIAAEQGFINAHKQESQDICFVSQGSYTDFIKSYTKKVYPPGNFVDTSGQVLGRHKGLIHYTVGQRKGLGLALSQPHYVAGKSVKENTVTLVPENGLYTQSLLAREINLIAWAELKKPLKVTAKTRSRQEEVKATVTQLEADLIQVDFQEPQRAVAPGQAVVLYQGELVVGGGKII